MQIGRLLIGAGAVLVLLGALILTLNRFNLPLGRLPGDVVLRRRNATVYFPWVTCLALSALGSLLLWLFNRKP